MAETSQTIYQTTLPPWAEKQYGELLNQGAKQIYNTDSSGLVTGVKPYTPYGGDRIADFTTDQLKVQSGVAGLTAPGQFAIANTGLAGVAGLAGTAAPTGLSQAFGYAPGAITADTVTTDTFSAPGTAASYMSPYQQNVTDIQIDEARRQADIAKSGAAMGSIGRGTFGGARQALMQSEADRNLATQLGAIQATGSQNAYQQAQQAFQADQQRALQAQQANQGAGLQAQQYTQQGQQFGAGLGKDIGLAGLTMGLEGAKTSGQLGATEQIATLERLKAQSLSAAEQQAMQQQINDLNYQEFLNAQNYPREMLDWQAGILKGVPTPTSQTQTQTQPSPSLASQLLGAGLGALGAYKAFNS
jgi:hypothetical protein